MRTCGHCMPTTAHGALDYEATVKLDGPAKYHLSYRVLPPRYVGFFRHTDKEAGVAAWWNPVAVGWDLVYVGVGKKGGY